MCDRIARAIVDMAYSQEKDLCNTVKVLLGHSI